MSAGRQPTEWTHRYPRGLAAVNNVDALQENAGLVACLAVNMQNGKGIQQYAVLRVLGTSTRHVVTLCHLPMGNTSRTTEETPRHRATSFRNARFASDNGYTHSRLADEGKVSRS
jgi:hypothetical protein